MYKWYYVIFPPHSFKRPLKKGVLFEIPEGKQYAGCCIWISNKLWKEIKDGYLIKFNDNFKFEALSYMDRDCDKTILTSYPLSGEQLYKIMK